MTKANGAQIFAVFDEAMLRTGSRADFVFETLRDAVWDGRIGRGIDGMLRRNDLISDQEQAELKQWIDGIAEKVAFWLDVMDA